MPINIDFLANTSKLERGGDNVERALEDVADSLDDVARDGDRSLGRLERSFKDAADAAKDTERAAKKVGDGGKEGFGKASDAAGEFKSEALQNLSEVSSSFTGDLQSIGDLAQGTFGGLAASLPGVLGAAGAGAAVGVGLITAAFVAAEERRKQLEQRASDLGQAYIDAGSTVLSSIEETARAAEILSDPELRKELDAYAAAVGDRNVALGALIGRSEDLAKVQALVNEAETENAQLNEQQVAASSKRKSATSETIRANEELIAKGRELLDVNSQALGQFNTYSEYLNHVAQTTSGATSKIDEFGDTVVTLPDGKTIYIDAETGQATDSMDAIEQRSFAPKAVPVDLDTTQADLKLASFRTRVQQRLGIPVSVTAPPGIAKYWE